jgi:TusA-related sulfurtransferase
MPAGQTLEVTADDPAFGTDIKAWIKNMGYSLLDACDSKLALFI